MILDGRDEEAIRQASEAVRSGLLVGMPTETVYGIAGDAMSRGAIRSIFRLKGRPESNPLIVHLASAGDMELVVSRTTRDSKICAKTFWPGPLTLVLPKRPEVPPETTGGLDTVAVRVPSHEVALALLKEAGIPLAAPSANRFMGLSPTHAEDIDPMILKGLACVLDGGECEVGIESTVLDLTESEPRILRPGAIGKAEIEAALGKRVQSGGPKRSPGMYPRHYAPRTPVRLVDRLGGRAAGLTFEEPQNERQIKMPLDANAYASKLYRALAQLDRLGERSIDVQTPPQSPDWDAVNDRLGKAAHEA